MLNNLLIFSLSLISFSTISYIIYIKIIEPLSSIKGYIQEAQFEHNIINELENATGTQGLSERYNSMLDNNISSSSYFDKLQHTLKQREMSPTYTSPIKLNNSILNQARLLQQKKKQINYH
ncbi:hypothetical protein [Moritella viscosa]|uniref:Asparaginyl-tRNA synthetase n=1 Tax=Moritella viscosa TaxID=80854 RepID=A0A090IIH4_9GAMM|nr:hypothetical protein [Moritella viscosa]CED59889.1 membrane protein [Moritella viscosa]SGY87408.1 Asparaginyl-tRNA synthetase [Moritella viscosa]SGY90499.1 Asparaginyl-tRNA synthetase [Moritella viscosa]SGY93085.1 Asparaginyl-tRNA synthetase [Moritella viscosa]SHO02810.1 Asparaginyl-tRNA synthetase [Moritella viscosa]